MYWARQQRQLQQQSSGICSSPTTAVSRNDVSLGLVGTVEDCRSWTRQDRHVVSHNTFVKHVSAKNGGEELASWRRQLTFDRKVEILTTHEDLEDASKQEAMDVMMVSSCKSIFHQTTPSQVVVKARLEYRERITSTTIPHKFAYLIIDLLPHAWTAMRLSYPFGKSASPVEWSEAETSVRPPYVCVWAGLPK